MKCQPPAPVSWGTTDPGPTRRAPSHGPAVVGTCHSCVKAYSSPENTGKGRGGWYTGQCPQSHTTPYWCLKHRLPDAIIFVTIYSSWGFSSSCGHSVLQQPVWSASCQPPSCFKTRAPRWLQGQTLVIYHSPGILRSTACPC